MYFQVFVAITCICTVVQQGTNQWKCGVIILSDNTWLQGPYGLLITSV